MALVLIVTTLLKVDGYSIFLAQMNRTLILESACVRHCLTVHCQQQSLANVATCRSTSHHRWSMYLRAHYVLHNVSHSTCSSASQYAVFTQNSTFKLTMCTATVNCYSPPTLDSITVDKQAVMHDLLFIDTDRLLVCARHVHWTTSTETHNLSSRVS